MNTLLFKYVNPLEYNILQDKTHKQGNKTKSSQTLDLNRSFSFNQNIEKLKREFCQSILILLKKAIKQERW